MAAIIELEMCYIARAGSLQEIAERAVANANTRGQGFRLLFSEGYVDLANTAVIVRPGMDEDDLVSSLWRLASQGEPASRNSPIGRTSQVAGPTVIK